MKLNPKKTYLERKVLTFDLFKDEIWSSIELRKEENRWVPDRYMKQLNEYSESIVACLEKKYTVTTLLESKIKHKVMRLVDVTEYHNEVGRMLSNKIRKTLDDAYSFEKEILDKKLFETLYFECLNKRIDQWLPLIKNEEELSQRDERKIITRYYFESIRSCIEKSVKQDRWSSLYIDQILNQYWDQWTIERKNNISNSLKNEIDNLHVLY